MAYSNSRKRDFLNKNCRFVVWEGEAVEKALTTLAVLAAMIVLVIAAGFALAPESTVRSIEADSPCPVAGCASGACHGFGNVPVPDGVHEMACPEATCASVECHAWDSLIGRYHQASDASLNLWILTPVVLVAALMVMANVFSRKGNAR